MTSALSRLGLGALAIAAMLTLSLVITPAQSRAEVVYLTPDEALLTARAAYLAGDVATADHIARALANVQPDNPLVHLLLAATEVQLGRPEAGLAAGKRAWRLTESGEETRPLRYEIARNTAKAALDAGRPLTAQLWLRRSLDAAPDPVARAASGRDLAFVRARSPWRLRFSLRAGPSDNLNGGAESGVFRVGDFVLGDLSNGAEALSGSRVALRFAAERALPARGRAQTVLTFGAETVAHRIDAAGRAKAGRLRSGDLDRSRLAFGLRRDMRLGDTGLPFSLSAELAQTWAGGVPAGRSLGLMAQMALMTGGAGGDGAIWANAGLERTWDAFGGGTTDRLRLGISGQTRLTRATIAAGLSLEAARAGSVNATYDAAEVELRLTPDWRPAGTGLTLGLSAGIRDYDQFSLIAGAVNVTGGRQDHSVGVTLDIGFEALSVMGFSPVLSVNHGRTRSNVSRYQTKTSGISIGLSSEF